MKAISLLHNIGVRTEQPEYLQEKIRLGNAVTCIGLGVCIPYIAVASFLYPSLLPYYVSNTLFYIFSLCLSATGLHSLSRVLFCLYASICTAVVSIAFQAGGADPLLGFTTLQIAMTALPWLLFDLRETGKLGLTVSVHGACLLAMWYGGGWWETGLDSRFLEEPIQELQFVLSSVLVLCACLLALQKSHQRVRNNNERLINNMKAQQDLLQEKESSLSKYVTEVEEAQRVNQQRQWASDGLATFADLLRRESSNPVRLYEQLIVDTVRYLRANQGGLFLLQDGGTAAAHIELVSCYAYERSKHQRKRIEIGEGLVGQAVQEMDTLYLTDIPPDYVHITSGLGKATPTCLLIVPLRVNEQIEGVLELASFQEFEPYQIEFLQKLGESIAATVATNRINERTRKLLEASQWQTEQMRAQEEEMRQNMEELAATQEEMERKTKEMESLYEQSQGREREMMQNMATLEETRQKMEIKQHEVEQLLKEAQRNEEQLRHQEDTLKATLESIQAAHEELAKKAGEIEETKKREQARAESLIESQKRAMEKVLEKQKAKETDLQQKIETLRLELSQYKPEA